MFPHVVSLIMILPHYIRHNTHIFPLIVYRWMARDFGIAAP